MKPSGKLVLMPRFLIFRAPEPTPAHFSKRSTKCKCPHSSYLSTFSGNTYPGGKVNSKRFRQAQEKHIIANKSHPNEIMPSCQGPSSRLHPSRDRRTLSRSHANARHGSDLFIGGTKEQEPFFLPPEADSSTDYRARMLRKLEM